MGRFEFIVKLQRDAGNACLCVFVSIIHIRIFTESLLRCTHYETLRRQMNRSCAFFENWMCRRTNNLFWIEEGEEENRSDFVMSLFRFIWLIRYFTVFIRNDDDVTSYVQGAREISHLFLCIFMRCPINDSRLFNIITVLWRDSVLVRQNLMNEDINCWGIHA